MSTLYESFTETATHSSLIYTARWRAMTFTPTAIHNISSVQIHCRRWGTPGTITISIRAVDDDNLPTGDDLTSGTFNGDSLSSSVKDWAKCPLTLYTLAADTRYAIVIRAPDGDSSNYLLVDMKQENGTNYANGQCCASTNSGTSWSLLYGGTYDYLFKEYGESEIGRRHWFVEEEDFHYFGESGIERKLQGIAVGSDAEILPLVLGGYHEVV